jgi:hypothetical protein
VGTTAGGVADVMTIPDAATTIVTGDTPEWDRIIVEYADRLTEAGVNYWTSDQTVR